jgi:DNA mismatch endonuclease, patch repair protein
MAVPEASSPDALRRMQRQRRRDTKPEMKLRRELHRLGMRYRVDRAIIPGVRRRTDVVFTRARVAVFVDGCFWHGCPTHETRPKANAEWWAAKLNANVCRDRDTDARLNAAGWTVVRVWEHDDVLTAAARIKALVADEEYCSMRGDD